LLSAEEAKRIKNKGRRVMKTKDFYVIAVCSNQVRYSSRYNLFHKFKEHMEAAKAKLIIVEMAFGKRPFEVTDKGNIHHLQLRSLDELWHKENMINLGIQHLSKIHPNWKQVAWIDADVEFTRKDWIKETVHQLQHYHVVQMWENAIDLGPNGEALSTHYSFLSQYAKGKPYNYKGTNCYSNQWHPGYAWAASREAIDLMGQLIDFAILGAGDNHMAHALIGKLDGTLAKGLHPNYIKRLNKWQDQVEKYIRRDVGFVSGTLMHSWHGKKRDRRYHDRWKILVDNHYDPEVDLKRDSQGLYQMVDHGDLRSIKFRDQIRHYFRSRNEDSIDIV
jgi:hypothetical protein